MNDYLHKMELEIASYWPERHALDYWKKVLAQLEARVESTKNKIKELENDRQT